MTQTSLVKWQRTILEIVSEYSKGDYLHGADMGAKCFGRVQLQPYLHSLQLRCNIDQTVKHAPGLWVSHCS